MRWPPAVGKTGAVGERAAEFSATAAGFLATLAFRAVSLRGTFAVSVLLDTRPEVAMAPRYLVLYGTTDGHTRKIAGAIAETLRAAGDVVDLDDAHARDPVAPGAYDAVLVAASVHAGGYQRTVRRWVRTHVRTLRMKPTAFVSVCLGVLEHKPEVDRELNHILTRFFDRTTWQPTRVKIIAGALPFTRYGWLKRRVMRRIAQRIVPDIDVSRDYEYTDWADLKDFTLAFRQIVRADASISMSA